MSINFTTEYFPDIESELTDAQIATAREQVVQSLQPVMPDVDLSPGTPTGDFIVTPLAVYRAASGVAHDRLMSDLNLANVADGTIYSCDFVSAYLGNFAVYDVENLKATGLVRLTYSSPDSRTIPKTVRYRFSSDGDWLIRLTDPDATEVNILSAGSSHSGAADTYVLAQTSSTTWAVDIPVYGTLSSTIAAGASGTATEVPDELVGISAAIEFLAGVPSASLSDLAAMARKSAFSVTSGSRSATKAMVYRNWPESNMVSPVVTGDAEMQRIAAGSAMALTAPAVDLYFRSARDMQEETQNIRLDYVQPTAGGTKVFRGKLPLLHRPSRITSIEWSGSTAESLVDELTIYSRSSRSDLYGSLHCGTRYEDLYVEITPSVDESDTPLIPRLSESGAQYAIFTVTYEADPLLETVSSLLESPDYRPPGVDVLVKSGPLSVIDEMEITYAKTDGVNMTLSVARENIVELLRTSGYPDSLRITDIYDIMRNAGAGQVIEVSVSGYFQVSPADRRFNSDITDPAGDDLLGAWYASSDPFVGVPFSSLRGLTAPVEVVESTFPSDGSANAWSATKRTVRYAVSSDNIKFVEY